MPREIDLLATFGPRYARTIELNVITETTGFRYSIELAETHFSSGEFEVTAAHAESAPETNVMTSFAHPQYISGDQSFGSNRLSSALRGQIRPVKYVTIRPTRPHVISYNAPKRRLEWESAEVKAYGETGSELAAVSRMIGWLQQDGQIFLVDLPQIARI